ncbi:MAG: hypothetical protein Q4G71_07975 [Pseudomonadota bacterium]|nr:hypothetical protein [Pseudomonadota bacterium]
MANDFASLNDRRWRAMTNDEEAVPVNARSHSSCAAGTVIRHRVSQMPRAVRNAMNH